MQLIILWGNRNYIIWSYVLIILSGFDLCSREWSIFHEQSFTFSKSLSTRELVITVGGECPSYLKKKEQLWLPFSRLYEPILLWLPLGFFVLCCRPVTDWGSPNFAEGLPHLFGQGFCRRLSVYHYGGFIYYFYVFLVVCCLLFFADQGKSVQSGEHVICCWNHCVVVELFGLSGRYLCLWAWFPDDTRKVFASNMYLFCFEIVLMALLNCPSFV